MWQIGLLEAARDLKVSHGEVVSVMEEMFNSAVYAVVLTGMLMMFVNGSYSILGTRHAGQKEEILEAVKGIW